jgi:hypothetical protein
MCNSFVNFFVLSCCAILLEFHFCMDVQEQNIVIEPGDI